MGIPNKEKGVKRNLNYVQGNANVKSDFVAFQVGKIGSEENWTIHAHTIQDMVKGTPILDWIFVADKYDHLKGLEIPKLHLRDKVKILLGTDYNHLIVCDKAVRGKDKEPIAEQTRLGLAFAGVVKNCIVKGSSGFSSFTNVEDNRAEENLQTYLEMQPSVEEEIILQVETRINNFKN